MKSGKYAFAVLLLLGLIFSLIGTSCGGMGSIKGSISGTVFVDGRPQAFGTVQVHKDGHMIAQERCTQTGHYIIKGLDAGTYEVLYLNARGNPIGEVTIVQVRMGRFEQVDLELTFMGIDN